MSAATSVNPDQALLHRFAAEGGQPPLAVDSNPMALALGTRLLKVDLASGQVELAFEPQPLFIQGTQVLQGGAVTAMLDFAMAFATLAALPPGHSCATVNLATSFLRPALPGRYVVVGQVERLGKTLAFTGARMLREEGRVVVASATSTLAVIRAAS